MPNTVSALMSGVRGLCTNGQPPTEPTQEELSDSHILTTLNDEESSLNAQQTLSQQNQLLQFQMLGTPARTVPLSIPNYNSTVQIQYQVDPVYDRWVTLPIINKVEIDDAESEGRLACALYGTPPVLCFSFVPSVALPVYPFRIWYETSPSDLLPQSAPRLNPQFYNLLKYSAAIICREVFMGLELNLALHAARDRYQAQYDKYANRSPDQRSRVKPAAYGTENIGALYEPYRT